MDFDNRDGNKLYTTAATHDAEYKQKMADNSAMTPVKREIDSFAQGKQIKPIPIINQNKSAISQVK